MGYREGYVANVLNGCTKASDSFREAFGAAVAELLLGSVEHKMTTPSGGAVGGLNPQARSAGSK